MRMAVSVGYILLVKFLIVSINFLIFVSILFYLSFSIFSPFPNDLSALSAVPVALI